MKSILDSRPALKAEIDKVAEVAGYLWEKGWAERNGGNITINISEMVDDVMRKLPSISPPKKIGKILPHLKGCWFYCKGTQKRMRDLARAPMENGSIIRISEDCIHYEIVADAFVAPTSELHRFGSSRLFACQGLRMSIIAYPPIEQVLDAFNNGWKRMPLPACYGL